MFSKFRQLPEEIIIRVYQLRVKHENVQRVLRARACSKCDNFHFDTFWAEIQNSEHDTPEWTPCLPNIRWNFNSSYRYIWCPKAAAEVRLGYYIFLSMYLFSLVSFGQLI